MQDSGRTGSQNASRLNLARFSVRRLQFPVRSWEGGQPEKMDGTYGSHGTYGNVNPKTSHSLKRSYER
jgi:hypothetical protein